MKQFVLDPIDDGLELRFDEAAPLARTEGDLFELPGGEVHPNRADEDARDPLDGILEHDRIPRRADAKRLFEPLADRRRQGDFPVAQDLVLLIEEGSWREVDRVLPPTNQPVPNMEIVLDAGRIGEGVGPTQTNRGERRRPSSDFDRGGELSR